MPKVLKAVTRFAYNAIYVSLQKTWKINPFIPKKVNNRKVLWGHARIEQEINPDLDKKIIKELDKHGIAQAAYFIDIGEYNNYFSSIKYPLSYYGSPALEEELIEKSLEHFVSLSFLDLTNPSIVIDAGAGNSPFYKIAADRNHATRVYRQDKLFTKGINGNTIGGSATELPFPDSSVDAITLHCSLEHFENRQDVDFFLEAERVLKPGGKCIVLPFYLSSHYTVHFDPVKNFLNFSKPNARYDGDAVILYYDSRQRFSRHYDVKTFKERILNKLKKPEVKIFSVANYKDVHPDCYLRFIAVFTKT